MMTKLEMLQKMKQEHGSQTLILFRNGDNYETYYSDAEKVSEILSIELQVIDSVPTISITRDEVDKILDQGFGVSMSQALDKDGNYAPYIPEPTEVLHLYDEDE